LHIREDHVGFQKARADPPRSFPRFMRFAPQVVDGRALLEFSKVATSR
jgi:hypothetical protein